MIAVALALLGAATVLGPLALLCLGLHHGDRADDVHTAVELRRVGGQADEVVVQMVNPGVRPVLVSVRMRPAGRIRRWLWTGLGMPYDARTRVLPRTPAPERDALLLAVPAAARREVCVPLGRGPARLVRIEVVAFERVGRVRTHVHLLSVACPTLAGGMSGDRSGMWVGGSRDAQRS